MEAVKIDPDQIGAIIGKGGSTIRSLEEEFEVSIDIQEDGTVRRQVDADEMRTRGDVEGPNDIDIRYPERVAGEEHALG